MRRKPEVPEAGVHVEESLDGRARLKAICTTPSRKKWHPPECLFNKSESGCRLRSKKKGDKSAAAMLERNEQHQRTGRLVVNVHSSNTRQLVCVFQDMEPPKSSSILRKSSDIRKPIRCVKFTNAIAFYADIRDQNPSLRMICPGEPHQRNFNAPKFEDRSQVETECQEQGAREAAWRLAKSVQGET